MKFSNNITLFIIIAIATILRLYNFFEIPFTHDEFSAFFRLNYTNFSELIEKGVINDGHPAGIQVFLYYWTKLVGYQEWIIKFPFTLMGITSVYLVYSIGKKLWNETVGLVSASYIATIQYMIMYSQIARPYISGMFFALLMVNYLINIITNPQKNLNKNLILFTLSASLCSYNHHFSLLFAVIIGITGLFVIQKIYLKKYLLSCLVIFLLYIPHLKIFIYQLHVGGVGGWLAKPENDFLIQYLYYIFNFSVYTVAIMCSIVIYGIIQFKRNNSNGRFVCISLIWFITPFLIGFFYSKYVNAVLQYSVLIFSFPFLLFGIFGILKQHSSRVNFVLVLIILIVNTSSLVYGRKHYEIFYNSIYEHILTDIDDTNSENSIVIIDSNKPILKYYINKLHCKHPYIFYSDAFPNLIDLKRYLEKASKTKDTLYFGCLSSINPNAIPIIQEYYPTIIIQNDYFGGSTYVFSKKGKGNKNVNNDIANLDFENTVSKNWKNIVTSNITIDNFVSTNNYYVMTHGTEWGPKFSIPLKDIINNENNFIDISVNAKSKTRLNDLKLVASLDSHDQNIRWESTDFSAFELIGANNKEWQKCHHSMKLSDINLNYDNIILNIYIWNPSKKECIIDNFKITVRNGNSRLYGLIEQL